MTTTAPPMTDVRLLPERIERLLDAIATEGGVAIAERAEDLVAAVVGLYGAGLARIVDALDDDTVRRLADGDELVAHLLLLHDLHPDDTPTRIQAALDRVRPYLGSHAGGIELLGVTADGIARLRLSGSCDSCPSSAATVEGAIERAVLDAAPEIVAIEVDGIAPPPPAGGLLQIGRRRPEFDSCPVPP